MRHKFLKVAALFVAGAFAMNVGAQTDVTSQYLTNADFEAGTASTAANIFGYGKDGTPYGLQEVQGWTINHVKVDNANANYPNSGMAGATLAYGSSTTLKGNNKGAPSTGVNGATGNCLGFMAVWSLGGYYSQEVTFPAGIYTMTASFYNQSGTQANTSKTGFITEDLSYTMPVNTTVGEWVTQSVSFTLTAETKGKIAVGYVSTGSGSGANPHIFIDDIKLSYEPLDLTEQSWTAPIIGVNLNDVDDKTELYMYNVKADAFASAGMAWGTHAIVKELQNGDSKLSADVHRCRVSKPTDGQLQIMLNEQSFLGGGGPTSTNDCWVNHANHNIYTYNEVSTNVYTLKPTTATDENYLDCSWKYGGHITFSANNGYGNTEWAFVLRSDITSGKYLLYKAKKEMYDIYDALVKAGKEDTYAEALGTANIIYNDANSTAATVNAATKVLLANVAPALTSGYFSANSLFKNPDMRGYGDDTDWGNGLNAFGDGIFESWHSSETITQKQTGLPNGFYTVEFIGIYRQDGGDAAPTLTLTSGSNSTTTNLKALTEIDFGNCSGGNNWTAANKPNDKYSAGEALAHTDANAKVENFFVENGELTITMAMPSGSQWLLCQGFRISFKAESLEQYANMFNEAKAAAEAIAPATLNTYAASVLSTALSNAANEQANKNWYQTATANLNAATELASSMVAPYAKVKDLLATSASILSNSLEFVEGASTAFTTAISTAETDVEVAETPDAITKVYDTLEVRRQSYVQKADPINETYFDYTFMITNPSFDNYKTDGWKSEGNASNKQIAQNKDNGIITGPFFENWNQSNFTGSIYQNVTGLPSGKYLLRMAAYGSGTYIFANKDSVDVTTADGAWYEVTTTVSDGNLKIGIQNDNKNTWMGIDNASLKYYGFDIKVAQDGINSLKSRATEMAGKPMNATVATALDAAIAGADATKTTRKELTPMLNALNKAVADAEVSVAEYELSRKYIDKAKLFDIENADLMAWEAQYAAGTLTEAELVRQALNVWTYNYVSTNFKNEFALTNWGAEKDAMWSTSGQHWDGTTGDGATSYYDANGTNTTHTLSKTIELTPGTYVFRGAGRSHPNTTLSLSIDIDNIKPVVFNAKDNVGLGIDINGQANFSKDGSYANKDNQGCGWEWEFIKFTLTDTTTVTLTATCKSSGWGWASFANNGLWMDDATYMTIYMPTYNKHLTDAMALEDKAMEATAKTQLKAALEAAKTTPTTPAELNAQSDALKAAIDKAAPSVEAYKTIAEHIAKAKVYDHEKVASFETKYNSGAFADNEVTTVQQELNVITYDYVVNKFNNGIELGKWTSDGNNTSGAELTENHWSGENRNYYNQKDGDNPKQGWHADAWSLNFNKEVALPAGEYVLKVAGRKSAGTDMKLTVTLDDIVLDSICDFPASADAMGINKAGAASFDANDPAGFANEGKGLGWQWRFAKFTLATADTVKIAVNAEAKSVHQWMSFSDCTVQMDDATVIAYHMPRYEASMETAQALASKPMEATKAEALNTAIAAVDMNSTSPAEIEAMITALDSVVKEVTPSAEAYAAANEYFKVVSDMLTTTNLYAQDSCKKYYTEPLAKYDARTLTIEETKILTKGGGHKQENKIDDMLLPFWTINGKQAKDYETPLYINTWSTEGERDSSMFVTPFFEFYVADDKVLGDSTITATIKGLTPNRLHSFTLRSRVRATNDSIKAANAITMTVGEGDPVDISAGDSILDTRFYAKSYTAEGMTDENGTLVVTINVAKNSNISWFSFRNVRYTEGEDLTAYIENYNMVLKNAKDEVAKAMYADDKAALEAEITNNLFADIVTAKKNELLTATDNLKAILTEAQAATAVYNNNQVVVQEINKAKAIGVDVTTYETNVANKQYADAVAATAGVQALMVDEYTYVTANYKYDIKLGEWTKEGPTGEKSDQHWSGSTNAYLEQSSNAWSSNSWNIKFTQEIALPAGEYVLKAAGRKSANATLELTASIGDTILGTVNDYSNGDTGLGINKAGATSFDANDAAGFTNDNKGRGWQWRYVKFSLAAADTVKIAINAEAKAAKQWISFGDYVLLTNSDANIAMKDYNTAKANAEKAIADEQYNSVVGAARTNLKAAIDKNPGTTAETINAAKAELEATTKTFTEALEKYNALSKAITDAEAIELTNVGDEAFQIPTAAVEKLEAAIATNKLVLTSTTATVAEVEGAKKALDEAVKAFGETALNAPAKDTRYNIVMSYEGWEYNGKAVTYIANDRQDAGLYNIKYYSAPNANYAQAFTFTAVDSVLNGYNLSMTDVDGNERYICTGVAYGGNTAQLRTTTDASKALVVEVKTTDVEGEHNLWNTEAKQFIGGQDAGFFTVNSHTNFKLVAAEEAEVTVDITIGYATLMLPFNAELPAGMKAYTCTANADEATLTLTEVKTLAANTPYLVEGEGSFEFNGYGLATKDSYTSASLTGTYTEVAAPVDSYVLQQLDGYTAFYHVAKDKQPKVGANRCYLTVPAGTAKAPMFSISRGEDTTGIENSTLNAQPSTVIYDLMGRKVDTMVKGNMYIVNGKKVIK